MFYHLPHRFRRVALAADAAMRTNSLRVERIRQPAPHAVDRRDRDLRRRIDACEINGCVTCFSHIFRPFRVFRG